MVWKNILNLGGLTADEAIIIFGGLYVFIYAAARFGRWPIKTDAAFAPKYYTYKYRYYLSLLAYISIYILTYSILATLPELSQTINELLGKFSLKGKDPALFAIILLTSAISNTAFLKKRDRAVRNGLLWYAGSPGIVEQRCLNCQSIFTPDETKLNETTKKWSDKSRLDEHVLQRHAEDRTDYFIKTTYLLDQLLNYHSKRWTRPYRFLHSRTPLDSINKGLIEYLRDTTKNFSDPPVDTEQLLQKAEFKQEIQQRFKELSEIMCCMIVSSYSSSKVRANEFKKMGFDFIQKDSPGIATSLMIISTATAIITFSLGTTYYIDQNDAAKIIDVVIIWLPLALLFFSGTTFFIHMFHDKNDKSGNPCQGTSCVIISFCIGLCIGLAAMWGYVNYSGKIAEFKQQWVWALISGINGVFISLSFTINLQHKLSIWGMVLTQGIFSAGAAALASFLLLTTSSGHEDSLTYAAMGISGLVGIIIGVSLYAERYRELQQLARTPIADPAAP